MDRLIATAVSYSMASLLKKNVYLFRQLEDAFVIQNTKDTLEKIGHSGNGIMLNGRVYISHPNMVTLGKNIHIGNNAYFFTLGGLTIGDNAHISRNVTIYTANHKYEGNALPYDESHIQKPVVIEQNVWIGMNVSIIPGIKIGEGSIIGMGSVITKDVSPYSIIGSTNQKLIKERNKEDYNVLLKSKSFGGVNGVRIKEETHDELGFNGYELGTNLVFAIGTGRCGSMALANLLSSHPEINFKHEPNGQLIKLSTDYEHNQVTRDQVLERIKAAYVHSSIANTRIYGESDQKLSNLIEVLYQLFPKAKFIWMLRNAKSTIESTYSRGWFDDSEFGIERRVDLCVKKVYSSHIYSENRLNGFKAGAFSFKEWMEMSPFERNCWYWRYWNEKILNQLKNIPKRQWRLQKLESLHSEGIELFEFLGLNNNREIQMNEKINPTFYPMVTLDKWDSRKITEYKKWCKDFNDLYY
ncbi:MAG: DapH/DapD/GlmU-related protein [Bacteroidota bacterium]